MTNQISYWKRREQENIAQRIKTDRELVKQIEQIYLNALVEIQKEIDGFIGRYASRENLTMADAKRRVSQMDVKAYEAKAKQYVKDKNFSPQANYEMKLYNLKMKMNRLDLLRSNVLLEMTDANNALQRLLEEYLSNEVRAEYERQAGILGAGLPRNFEELIKDIVNGSYKNATFDERIWGMLQTDLRTAIERLLSKSLIQGLNPRKIAEELRKIFGATRYQAERLARTEMARIQSDVQKHSYEHNDIDKFIFIREPTACRVCKGVSTEPILLKEFEVGLNVAPIHPNCRCSTAPYFDRKDFEKHLKEEGV